MPDLLWWAILVTSVILIVREMGKWLRSRTKRVEAWVDTLGRDSPSDELEEVARQLKDYSEGEPYAAMLTKQRILETIKDRIGFKLNIEKDEQERLLQDATFLQHTFGAYPLIIRYVSREWLTSEQSTISVKERSRGEKTADALLREVKDLLDSLERWEEDYGRSGSF